MRKYDSFPQKGDMALTLGVAGLNWTNCHYKTPPSAAPTLFYLPFVVTDWPDVGSIVEKQKHHSKSYFILHYWLQKLMKKRSLLLWHITDVDQTASRQLAANTTVAGVRLLFCWIWAIVSQHVSPNNIERAILEQLGQ